MDKILTYTGPGDSNAISLINRMTTAGETPTVNRQIAIDKCIKKLKAANLFSNQFDVLVVCRGHGVASAKMNWIKNSSSAIGVSNPNFATDIGFNSDGTTTYIKTQYNPSADASLFTLNNACFGYKNSGFIGSGVGDKGFHGAIEGGGAHGTNIGTLGARINTTFALTINGSTGYNCVSRDVSAGFNYMIDSSLTFYAGASTEVVSFEMYMLAISINGNLYTTCNATEILETYWMGKAMSQSQFLTFQSIMNEYFNTWNNTPLPYLSASNNLVPSIIYDGSTVAWYDYKASNTLTLLDSSVSRWNDKLGSGRDLIQDISSNMPKLTSTGILFDGVDEFMRTATFTYNQPCMIYLVIKQPTWALNDMILGLKDNNGPRIQQTNTSKRLTLVLDANLIPYSAMDSINLDTYFIFRALFNGATTSMAANQLTSVDGSIGTGAGGAITIGTRADGTTQFANVEFKELIFRNAIDSSENQMSIYNYLYNKHFKYGASFPSNVVMFRTPVDETETTALLARMSVQPSTALKWLINKTIKDLKDNGIWSKLDCYYRFDLHTQQASSLNWIKDEHNITVVGSPLWTNKLGFTGVAGANYLRTNFNPSTNGVNYTLEDNSFGANCLNEAYNETGGLMGAFTNDASGNVKASIIRMRRTLNDDAFIYNNNTNYASHPATSTIYFHVNRRWSGNIYFLKNAQIYNNSTRPTVGFTDLEYFILTYNNYGSPATVNPMIVSDAFMGGSLTLDQHTSLYNITTNFRNNITFTF